MPKENRLAEIVDRQDEIALAVTGIDYTIKSHNEPLVAKRNKLVAEYNELAKEKEKLLPKKEKVEAPKNENAS